MAGGQSVVSSWWGLQLSGLRQSSVDYTPSNVGAVNVAHVIIPLTQASATGVIVRGAASQTANLQEWQDSTGTVLASVGSSGALTVPSATIAYVNFYSNGNTSFGGTTQTYNLTAGSSASVGTFTVTSTSASTIGAVIRAAASQTAPLQEWQDNAGTVLARVESNGSAYFVTLQNSSGQNVLRAESSRNLTILTGGTGSFGGGGGVLFVANAATVPSSNPSGGGILYVEAGALKYRGSSGTVTPIANA